MPSPRVSRESVDSGVGIVESNFNIFSFFAETQDEGDTDARHGRQPRPSSAGCHTRPQTPAPSPALTSQDTSTVHCRCVAVGYGFTLVHATWH